ncbi:biliverdin-producing heme oxygenase [Roseomonas nepalensis]|uniref:Biliverdin-producing heme oxygenase n=1 Tax=Muricoccus nepalensis TaxID=1854500 RepID=A0A502FIA3_9PROT|nr:biliverdin-producing heme oxygenase [Roseomonas nepalensis]TPG49200.1 biliverdin-producing heme oxygenase [Roseomonas nepalensis]
MLAEGSLRDLLRAGTREEHERLDAGLDLTSATLTAGRYRRVLERFHGFWAGWEPRVAAELGDEALFGPRRRLHLVRDDLRALGARTEDLPVCPPPPIRGRAEAMGSLYVMEGSTLGGRVILKRLDGLGLPEGSRGYFAGHGARTGAMWTAFLERLEAEAEPDTDAVLRGARATFATLGDWVLGAA